MDRKQAAALLRERIRWIEAEYSDVTAGQGYAEALREAVEALERIPAVDAVEMVHGEWCAENRRPKSCVFYCSECKRTCYDIQPIRSAHWKKRCRYAYCPNCGARMDGRREEEEHDAAD